MSAELIVLRLVHVLTGIFWVGSALFTTFFLAPAMAGAGPAAGQVMAGMRRRGMMTIFPIVATLTILSGIRLIWIASGGFSPAYFDSATGFTLAAAGAAAIVAYALGLFVARPAMARAGRIGGSLASAPADGRAALEAELARLQRRGAVTNAVVVTLLLLSAAGMAVARYLG